MIDKDRTLKILAENIRAERGRKNLTQEYLAEKADITQQHLYRIEHEKVCPTILVVTNIALALDVDINTLLPMETIKKIEENDKNNN